MKTTRIFSEMEIPSVYVCGASMQGDREYQQDAMMYKRSGNGVLAVVCDGMGGLEAGERASMEAVRIMEEKFDQLAPEADLPEFFKQSAVAMDSVIAGLSDKDGRQIQAGTTITAVYTRKNELYWMSVGDSKLYLFRDGELEQVTKPHNYRTWMNHQALSRERDTIISGARQEALVSYLGMDGIRLLDYNEKPFLLRKGDIALLCTDGLYKAIPEEGIRQILDACREEFDITAETLIDTVQEYGIKPLDNCTAVLLKYLEED
ncbi:MAG: PP2C family protein-serine/threonine phosphatase [Eubacteriales bacterium]|nr:PP2C family protein-serine/threonine phosphatase [Eubacteriales bacterium]